MDEDLFSAIDTENYKLAQDLIQKGARADTLVRDGVSALHLISGNESQEASKVLVYCARHSDPNVKSSEGLTPVHIAALWGRLQNLKILTSYGGDIYLTDDEGNNALDFACLSRENDAESCIKFLLELENSKPDVVGDLPAASYRQSDQNSKLDVVVDLPTASHEQSAGEFSDSFYTAIGDESVLDQTVVTFPKLHPWNVKICSKDFDVTVIDGMNDLSINESCSFADSNANDDSFEEENRELREQTFSLEDSTIEDPEFGDTTIFYDWKECSSIIPDQTDPNESVVIPESFLHLPVPDLRKKLEEYGEIPGPITPATKHVYIKRLARLHSGGPLYSKCSKYDEYLPEIREQMEGAETPDLRLEEESMCQDFHLKKNWREGTEKSSFNYLLIDPRVTQNLPARARKMDSADVFRVFIMSIFYVGKGKRSRPYAHLNEALQSSKHNAKIQQIQDIWAAGLGVVSLHIFQSVIPVEAYTREACMIDALGLSRLTNKKRGDFYGRAQTWPQTKRRKIGVYFLKRALKILLYEGERQLRPEDLRAPHSS